MRAFQFQIKNLLLCLFLSLCAVEYIDNSRWLHLLIYIYRIYGDCSLSMHKINTVSLTLSQILTA